ncbi:MAG: DUF3040 domain-containing protein [Actinomycetales bacterium]
MSPGVGTTVSLREVIVPLSEHEQRLLEQMEQQLSVEDPKFANAMRGSTTKAKARRRMVLGALGVLVGLGLVVLGVARGGAAGLALGIAGFAVMVAGAWLAVTPPRRKNAGPVGTVTADGSTNPRVPKGQRGAKGQGRRGRKGRANRGSGGFMSRMEQRWERRRGGGGWDA